ncbi:MAG: protein translocase subunit SecF [Actinomycetes bacterium]
MKTPSFDFIGKRRRWAAISVALLLVSLLSLAVRGLNLSIDFVGGTSFRLDGVTVPDLTAADLRDAVEGAGVTGASAQVVTEDDIAVAALVRTGAIEPGSAEDDAIRAALVEVSGADDVQVSFVGPSWGERISRKALEALVVFLVVVVAYISVRLEFKMAVAAVLALAHDVVITVGLYSLVGFSVSPSTVIALLTILGYSLYDSVVVFDRVEENVASIGGPGRRTYAETVNLSLNEVLWRSLNTSFTSLIPVGALLLVGAQLLGAETLQDLALALFIGIAIGAYSSIFLATPFLAWWKEKEPEYAAMSAKLAERIERGEAPAVEGPGARASRAPITTEYVRGEGKRRKRRR